MARIVFIGAGSFGFTRGLVKDVLTFPILKDSTLVLMDINKERLDFARKAVQRTVDAGKYPAKVVATMDRKKALKDADAVVCTILAGGIDIWRHDIEIPMDRITYLCASINSSGMCRSACFCRQKRL